MDFYMKIYIWHALDGLSRPVFPNCNHLSVWYTGMMHAPSCNYAFFVYLSIKYSRPSFTFFCYRFYKYGSISRYPEGYCTLLPPLSSNCLVDNAYLMHSLLSWPALSWPYYRNPHTVLCFLGRSHNGPLSRTGQLPKQLHCVHIYCLVSIAYGNNARCQGKSGKLAAPESIIGTVFHKVSGPYPVQIKIKLGYSIRDRSGLRSWDTRVQYYCVLLNISPPPQILCLQSCPKNKR